MVAKAQPKTRWGKAGTPSKIQSPRPPKNRAETTLVRHLTDSLAFAASSGKWLELLKDDLT
jgi:hypothetical protein